MKFVLAVLFWCFILHYAKKTHLNQAFLKFTNTMSKFVIKGGNKLSGLIEVRGAKNLAIKLLPAVLLSNGVFELSNMPDIQDVRLMVDMLKLFGAGVQKLNSHTYAIDCRGVTMADIPVDTVKKMRASFLFITPLLVRFGEVNFPHPGGDAIGRRPIDMVLEGLKQMGAQVEEKTGSYVIKAKRLKGTDVTFKWITHTGTEAMIMAAVCADGRTVLRNCALEPEVGALCEFLNKQGARITGVGTSTITIDGVFSLAGTNFQCIPDRLETGTFALMAAITGSEISIINCEPKHLEVFWKYLDLIGVPYELGENWVQIKAPHTPIKATELRTHEYPGFVTDLQAPFTVLMTQAHGLSMIHETIFDGRLFYTDILNSMGANVIMCDPHRVVVNGPTKLYGQKIVSPDVRAGMALVLAALVAEGTTTIDNIEHIDRGYENLAQRLSKLGADIQRVENNDKPTASEKLPASNNSDKSVMPIETVKVPQPSKTLETVNFIQKIS